MGTHGPVLGEHTIGTRATYQDPGRAFSNLWSSLFLLFSIRISISIISVIFTVIISLSGLLFPTVLLPHPWRLLILYQIPVPCSSCFILLSSLFLSCFLSVESAPSSVLWVQAAGALLRLLPLVETSDLETHSYILGAPL